MNDFTEKIKKILDTPPSEMDVEAAALILLQTNRNRILYQNILRRGDVEKLRYELQKMYNFRVKEDAAAEVKKMEKETVTIVTKTFPKEEKRNEEDTKGKRKDHDTLPDEIKALFVENLNIFPLMRKLHEQLKLLASAKACERYPFLKELVAMDKKLRDNWDVYDNYDAASATTPEPTPTMEISTAQAVPEPTPAEDSSVNETQDTTHHPDVKEINAARKYLSENKTKLLLLKSGEETEKYQALLKKVQSRLDLLLDSNAGISEDQLNELIALGCHA
jgi:hypothetical protein